MPRPVTAIQPRGETACRRAGAVAAKGLAGRASRQPLRDGQDLPGNSCACGWPPDAAR